MTKAKEKQKHPEPQFIYPENQLFLDGHTKKLAHDKVVAEQIAMRHGISPLFDLQPKKFSSSERLGFVFLIPGFIFLIGMGGWLSWIVFSIAFTEPTLPGKILAGVFGIFTLSVTLVVIYGTVILLNYRPQKAKQLYKDLLNGQVVVGNITKIRFIRGKTAKTGIDYIFQDETGVEHKGTISYGYMYPTDRLVEGTPIYILYADKKLHAPL